MTGCGPLIKSWCGEELRTLPTVPHQYRKPVELNVRAIFKYINGYLRYTYVLQIGSRYKRISPGRIIVHAERVVIHVFVADKGRCSMAEWCGTMDRDKIPTIASLMYDAQSEATSDWSEILDVEAEIILAVAV